MSRNQIAGPGRPPAGRPQASDGRPPVLRPYRQSPPLRLQQFSQKTANLQSPVSSRQSPISKLVPLALALTLILLASCVPAPEFDSNRNDLETPGAMARQPAAVSFIELDANPQLYRNNLVRVTGAHMPLGELPCESYKGPPATWALVDEGLRLDVQGFTRVIQLLPEGAQVTVDGFWRRYRGPVGCGKEPPTGTLWYLRAVRLVQPNPLPELAGAPPQPAGAREGATPTPETEGTPGATPTLLATETPTPTPLFTPTPSLTPDLTASPTPTPEPDGTPSATPSPTPEQDGEGTPTPSPTPNDGATLTPTPDGGGEPGPTSTPSDYPGPPPPDATPTPDSYG